MAAGRGNPGGVKARQAAADDHDLLGLRRRFDLHLGLPHGEGVHHAAPVGAAVTIVVVAPLEAADAGGDLIFQPSRRLVHKLGIGEQRPANGDEVYLALTQKHLRVLRLVDPARHGHGNVHNRADLLRRVHVIAGLHRRRSDAVAHAIHAAGNVDEVRSGFLQQHGDGGGVPGMVAVGYHVVAVEADADGVVLSTGLLDALNDHHRGPGTARHAAAKFIGAPVGAGRNKVVEKIAVGAVDLHHVKSGGLGPDGGGDEVLNEAVDFGVGHLIGGYPVCLLGDGAGGHNTHHGPPPAMLELEADLRARVMDSIHQLFQPRNHAVVGHGDLMVGGPAFLVDESVLRNNEADAAVGSGLQIGNQGVTDGTIRICQGGGHGGHDGPILYFHRADAAGGEQLLVFHVQTPLSKFKEALIKAGKSQANRQR